ncbi:MAG: hypothetical protein AABY46_03935 [Nitrospirota bacterium]
MWAPFREKSENNKEIDMNMDEAKAIMAGDAEQIMTGDVVPVANKYGDCEFCDGFGYIDGDRDGKEIDCPDCGGDGIKKKPEGENELVACPDCGDEVTGEWEVTNYCKIVLRNGRWVPELQQSKQDYDSTTDTRMICLGCGRIFTSDADDCDGIAVPAKLETDAET